jgi:predicted nucleic acid-binding protein
MPQPVFVDTNIIVYAHDRRDPRKQAQSRDTLAVLVQAGRLLTSTQVLAEFYWIATRKLPDPLPEWKAREQIEDLLSFARVVAVAPATLRLALQGIERYQLPIWDAQIWAAAHGEQCSVVFSEDFSHRQCLAGVTFLNPFADDFDIDEVD